MTEDAVALLASQPRGVYVDYCPDCGTSGGSPCRTPGGRKRADHKARKPECNGMEKCNLHGFVIGSPVLP